MTHFITRTGIAALLAGLAITAPVTAPVAANAAGADERSQSSDIQPVKIVELFTSQGCNSCPPADALLGKIAQRPGVLALSFHVDYWDYIGWKDTFALHAASERQRTYGRLMRWQYVYTPQMVINGQAEVVGSHARKLDAKIAATPPADQVHITVTSNDAEQLKVTLAPTPLKRPAWVWLVRYSPTENVDIRRGENSGKMLTYHNVVRKVERLTVWRGQKPANLNIARHDASLPANGRNALIVQTEGFGKILASARLPASRN